MEVPVSNMTSCPEDIAYSAGEDFYLIHDDGKGSKQPRSQSFRWFVRDLDAHLKKPNWKLRVRLACYEQAKVGVTRWEGLPR